MTYASSRADGRDDDEGGGRGVGTEDVAATAAAAREAAPAVPAVERQRLMTDMARMSAMDMGAVSKSWDAGVSGKLPP